MMRHSPAPRMSEEAFRRAVEEAKTRHNLSDIIAPYTALKRRGARELVGLCPFHPEKSPSFEVNDTKGSFYCHDCREAGDALSFLQKKVGLSFREAFEALSGDAFPTVSEDERARRKVDDAASIAQRVAEAREVWESGEPAAGTLAEVYCRARGITKALPPSVRFARTWKWRDHETGEQGPDLPAMLCALQDLRGEVVGIQRVFLQYDGRDRLRKGKAKLSLGVLVGSAFRASAPPPVDVGREWDGGLGSIIVTEGPEDALSLAQELPAKQVWGACGTAMMSRLHLPRATREVVLAGDNNAAGRTAVEEAAAVFALAGREVRTMYPDPAFKDWNDQLRGIAI
jgi:DNA primase